MGFDAPGIAPVKPKKKRAPLKRAAAPARDTGKGEGKPAAPRRPKVDTGNILAGAGKPSKKEDERARIAAARGPDEPKRKKLSYGRALKNELEGRGLLAEGARAAASAIGEGIAPSGKKQGKGGKAVATAVQATSPLAALLPKGTRKFIRRAAEDLVNVPAQAVPSLYVPAAAAVEHAKGRPERGRKFLKDVKEGDPLYALATGDFKRAGKLANEHPGFAALEAYGAKGMAGRTAGRAMRTAPKGSKIHKAASTKREPRTADDGVTTEHRRYSRDVTQKAVQVGVEKSRAAISRSAAKEAAETGSAALRKVAKVTNPKRMPEHAVMKRVDERVAVNEGRARNATARVTADVHHAVTNTEAQHGNPVARAKRTVANARGKVKPTAALTLHAQAIIDASPADLAAHRAEIAAQVPKLEGARKLAAENFVKQLDHAIAHPTDSAVLTRAAQRYADVMKPISEGLAARGSVSAKQAVLAPLVPYAVRKMGAEHVIPDTKAPRAALTKAHRAVDRARRDLDKATGRAEVLSRNVGGGGKGGAHGVNLARKDLALAKQRVAEAEENVLLAKPGLRGPDGERITPAKITAHMEEHGVEVPAFVAQAPPKVAGMFTPSGAATGAAPGKVRTGRATLEGTHSADPKALAETAVRGQRYLDAFDGHKAAVEEFAHPESFTGSKTAADNHARDLGAETGSAWRVVLDKPFDDVGKAAHGDELAGEAEGAPYTPKMQSALTDALQGKGGGATATYRVIPENVAQRLEQHVSAGGYKSTGAEVVRKVNSLFRTTVLSTSPTWAAGNVTEGALRAGLSRSGPLSVVTAHRALKGLDAIDPPAGVELRLRAMDRGHFGSAGRLPIRMEPQRLAGSRVKPLVEGLQKVWDLPPAKQAAGAWHWYTDLTMKQINGRYEELTQKAMLGRALRDHPDLLPGKGLRIGKEAIEQAAQGLRNTPAQAELATYVRRAYGRYGAFSPGMKMAVSMYTPFIAWTLNSVKFVTDVLPRDHPAALALITAAEQATEEWRKENGLDLFMGEGKKPDFLQGGVPLEGGRTQRAPFRFTPLGAFGDLPGTVAGGVLPQFSGVLTAFRGTDWKGAKLRKKDGGEVDAYDKAAVALMGFLDATVPGLSVGKRIKKKGVRKALNPLEPAAAGKAPGTGSRSSGGGTGSYDGLGTLPGESPSSGGGSGVSYPGLGAP